VTRAPQFQISECKAIEDKRWIRLRDGFGAEILIKQPGEYS